MIWDILEVIAHPKGWAISFRDGEIFIEEITVLTAQGTKVRGA